MNRSPQRPSRRWVSLTILSAATLSLSLASGFAGASRPAPVASRAKKSITLAMWLGPQGTMMVQHDIQAFEKLHPNIRVTLESLSWQAYNTKITTELISGSGPNVVEIPYESWIYSGYVKSLTPFLRADHAFHLSSYFPVAANYSRYNGRRFGVGNEYGLPWRCFTTAIFYNQTMFNKYHVPYPKPGWTYNTMLADARKLTHMGPQNNPNKSTIGLWWFLSKSQTGYDPVIWSFGGHEFNPRRTALTMNGPRSEAAIRWLMNAMYKWKVMATPIEAGSGFNFTANNIAMAEMHNAYVPSYRAIIGNTFKWGIAPMPKGPAGIAGSRVFVHTIGIARNAQHPRASWQLLTYLVGKASENALVKEGSLPALKSAAALYAKQKGGPPGMAIFYKDLAHARMSAMFNHDHGVEGIVNAELSLLWLNKVSIPQAIHQIEVQGNAHMKATSGF